MGTNLDTSNLVDLFLGSNDLNLLVNEVSRLLDNPVIVINTRYKILSSSNLFEIDDDTWNIAIKRGYCSYEYSVLLRKVASTNGASVSTYNTPPDAKPRRRRRGALVVDRRVVGYYSVLELNHNIEDVPDDVYDLIAKLFAKSLCIIEAAEKSINYIGYEPLFLQLLHGKNKNDAAFHENLLRNDFLRVSKFLIAVINMDDSTPANIYMDSLKHDLNNLFRNVWIVRDHNYIVILTDAQPFEKSGDHSDLELFLTKHNFNLGLSDTFSDITLLPEHYDQAKKTLRYQAILSENDTITYYDNYKLIEMLALLNDTSPIQRYCSSCVLDIQEYDSVNNTQYLSTLYLYLKADKSVNAAAKALFVHRNTIVYRINRIKELFNINFDNSYSNMHMYLSCVMLFDLPPIKQTLAGVEQ